MVFQPVSYTHLDVYKRQVEGEILFGGSYAMTSREERLSDLINKAGGTTTVSYTHLSAINTEEKN